MHPETSLVKRNNWSLFSRIFVVASMIAIVLTSASIFYRQLVSFSQQGFNFRHDLARQLQHPGHPHGKCTPNAWISPFRHRKDLGKLVSDLGFKIGVELGVKQGEFFFETVSQWGLKEPVDEYVLVDLWAPQDNYKDIANVPLDQHNGFMKETTTRGDKLISQNLLKKYTICRNYTTSCATQYPDKYFDYIYVDARHDYKGVLEDLRYWWPKLKHGGMMAGHDYTMQSEPPGESWDPQKTGQNWTVNFDGTVDVLGRVVRGAVDDFFSDVTGEMHGCPRQVVIEYRESHWNTWAVRK